MRIRDLRSELWVPVSIEQVFLYFSDPANLNEITPAWLRFQKLPHNVSSMGKGAHIDYSLRLRGLKIRWQSEITVWEPPRRFIDVQRKGPYKIWIHEHLFAERDGGTLITDVVTYAIPGGFLEPLIQRWLVRPDLDRIFQYRRDTLIKRFCGSEDPLCNPR